MERQCLFFTFNVATNECLLKSGLGTSVAGLQAYYISGPKYCGFSTGIKTNKTSFRPVSILLQELVFKPSLCFYGCKKSMLWLINHPKVKPPKIN